MHRPVTPSRSVHLGVSALALVLLAWLCLLAVQPSAADGLPAWLRWFGRPGSWPTIAIIVGLLVALCALTFRTHYGSRSGNLPIRLIAGLAATSTLTGMSSFWACHDNTHPLFFQPLTWTASLFTGEMTDFTMNGQTCPSITPDALVVARLAAFGAIFTGLAGVVTALFRSQVDRLRANRADSVAAVIGIDDDTRSMVSAIVQTLDRRSTLVVISGGPNDPGEQEARVHGSCVVWVDFNAPATMESLKLWRNLDRLYLMSADPSTNLFWLDVITRVLAAVGHKQRLPLIVRIDDPWQAEAWRAQQFGGSDTRWAADAVGKYEVTARWLLDDIIEAATIERVFVCGTSELTLALCADLSRRKLERDYYTAPGEPALPTLMLVGEDAEEYREDHEFHRAQLGFVAAGPTIDATAVAATVPKLVRLIGDGGAANSAAVFVDDWTRGPRGATTTGTRLAARFPTMPVYCWDSDAHMADEPAPIIGRLRTYRLAMDLPKGQAQDAWERAARLIHERFVASIGPQSQPHPARLPWAQLDDFFRGSNRRQVRNALWMVEQIAGHTWNTWGNPPTPLTVHEMTGLQPLEQLAYMGFGRDSAMKMARAEHQDWCRYYLRNGWKYGPTRDDEHRIQNKLVDWSVVEGDPEMLNAALTSLAATLWSLRQLGYRSRPVWRSFTRIGTVTAEKRSAPWTWMSRSGATMQANAGDWAVQADAESWSVRDDIFQATYEHTGGSQWRRRGTVLARPAQHGEIIDTLEGPATAADGDWVVQGTDGEQWPVPGDKFAQRYVECNPANAHAGADRS